MVHGSEVLLCLQLLATAMESNDTRSIIRTLPQQTVVNLPADQDLLAAATEGQQQLQTQPSHVRNASTTALLVQKLGLALPTGVSSGQPGGVLPLQDAQPYGNMAAGGALSPPATGQQVLLVQSQIGNAATDANNGTAASGAPGVVAGAAGSLLPAQAWQAYPEHKPDMANLTGTELYTSKGAASQQQEAGVNVTRSGPRSLFHVACMRCVMSSST